MSTPLDLDAIEKKAKSIADTETADVRHILLSCNIKALISEVEALRENRQEHIQSAKQEVNALRAKLEKAKAALRFIATSVERPGNRWPMAVDAAKEALAELEKP